MRPIAAVLPVKARRRSWVSYIKKCTTSRSVHSTSLTCLTIQEADPAAKLDKKLAPER